MTRSQAVVFVQGRRSCTSSARTPITRNRTGCFTCRKRKKRCDENRPICRNCVKTNHKCEFPQGGVEWKGGGTHRRPPDPSPVSTAELIRAAPTNSHSDDVDWDALINLPSSPSGGSLFDNQNISDFDTSQLEMDIMFNQLSMYSTFGHGYGPTYSQELELEPFVSPTLPFPVVGVTTRVKKQLFCHFTGVVSHVLTTCTGTSNPFNMVVIPIARQDSTVMDALLSLAGAQLAKIQEPNRNMDLDTETNILHGNVLRQQFHRVRVLKACSPGDLSQCKEGHLEVVFATSLLLMLYEICEGSGNDSWRDHLNTAGMVLSLASNPPHPVIGPMPRINLATLFHPFLLEFYLYHATLAAVTVPSTPIAPPQYQRIIDLLHQDSSVVGVQDGLNNFVLRVSALRSEAESGLRQADGTPDGDVIAKAVEISKDLEAWRPPQPRYTKPRNLITGFYQIALAIWLFSIVNPNRRDDDHIQENVRKISTGMNQLVPKDGVMACMLFPLFVAGSAAITDLDRESIRAHFRRLKRWSALGNIDLTSRVVEKMWQNYDDGVEGSWDWVKQFEDFGTSVLVT